MSLNNALRTPSGFNSNNAALRDTSSPSLNTTHESAHNNTSANASDSFSRAAIASTTRADLSALERPMLNSTRASTNTAAERPISNLENGVRSSPTAMTPNSEARVTAPSIEGSREPNTTPLASTSPETEASEKKKLLDLAKYTPESRHRDWNDYLGHCPLEHRSSCASLTQGQWSPRWHG